MRFTFLISILTIMNFLVSCGQSETVQTQCPDDSIPDATTLSTNITTWEVRPGQSIQEVIDKANHDDKIILLPGLHNQPVGKHDSVLFIDKAIDLEIMSGAELKAVVPDKSIQGPFVITNQSPVPVLKTDFIVNYTSLPQNSVSYFIQIDQNGLRWAVSTSSSPVKWEAEGIPVSIGVPIILNNSISITPTRTIQVNSAYFITFEHRPFHVIRIGEGSNELYISRVRIHGEGTINADINNNGQQTAHALTLSSGILLNGRVRDVKITGVILLNCQRAIQVYSENTGQYYSFGNTSGGISYNASGIIIDNVTVTDSIDGFLIGHPEHRGMTRNITISNNNISVQGIGIEPNFKLYGFEVFSNVVNTKSGAAAIHLVRGPSNCIIYNNVRTSDTINTNSCVMISTPQGWPASNNIILINNFTK